MEVVVEFNNFRTSRTSSLTELNFFRVVVFFLVVDFFLFVCFCLPFHPRRGCCDCCLFFGGCTRCCPFFGLDLLLFLFFVVVFPLILFFCFRFCFEDSFPPPLVTSASCIAVTAFENGNDVDVVVDVVIKRWDCRCSLCCEDDVVNEYECSVALLLLLVVLHADTTTTAEENSSSIMEGTMNAYEQRRAFCSRRRRRCCRELLSDTIFMMKFSTRL